MSNKNQLKYIRLKEKNVVNRFLLKYNGEYVGIVRVRETKYDKYKAYEL